MFGRGGGSSGGGNAEEDEGFDGVDSSSEGGKGYSSESRRSSENCTSGRLGKGSPV